ncbi:MAG: class I tRNA ligase family protein, partial [Candidatus Hydrogenedentes bacterium]|nr:class I tRNA ligase family protein [Candidatus Hydrogenedentota bacterium]
AIYEFVDSLSNWYVRRSRARFWASAWTQDKADAYWTLYDCLLKLARLAAPFTPFFAEVTWRNLAKPLPGAAESVHLTDYPDAEAAAIDQQLLDEMGVTREAVTLGLSARRAANIKVRQPLAECRLVLADVRLTEGLRKHLDLIMEELNIKHVEFTDKPEEYVSYEVRPNFKVLGPKFGKKVQAVRQALAAGDGAAFYRQLQDGSITLALDGEQLRLTGEDVEVRLTPKEGFAAAQGRQMVVVISTEITEALKREGLVRDFIRGVQELRKEKDLPYDARIQLRFSTADDYFAGVIEEFAEMIGNEVLAPHIGRARDGLAGARDLTIEDMSVSISIEML